MKFIKNFLILFLTFSFALISNTKAQSVCDSKLWKNSNLSVNERTELLINCMELNEKISQLLNASTAINRLDIKSYDW